MKAFCRNFTYSQFLCSHSLFLCNFSFNYCSYGNGKASDAPIELLWIEGVGEQIKGTCGLPSSDTGPQDSDAIAARRVGLA